MVIPYWHQAPEPAVVGRLAYEESVGLPWPFGIEVEDAQELADQEHVAVAVG